MKSHRLGQWIVCCVCSLLCAAVFSNCVIGGTQSCQTGADCPSTAPICAGQVCTVCQKDSDCPASSRCVLIGARSQCATGLPFTEGQLPDQGAPADMLPPESRGDDSSLPETPAQESTQPDKQGQEPTQDEPAPTEGDSGDTTQDTVPSTCKVGDVRDCYTGPVDARGQGECVAGKEACVGGQWGPCVGSVLPATEICDGKDNDCDGMIDNGNPDGGAVCDAGLQGECAAGTMQCQAGMLTCVANHNATTEICDGKDNDCDGKIDDGNPDGGAACTTTKLGECKAGQQVCTNGKLVCTSLRTATAEVCDGKDNDCDGQVDDGNPGGGTSCSSGQKGECAAGTMQCQSGKLTCVANNKPVKELCNGKDDDCDGKVDDGNPGGGAACSTTKLGECKAGQQVCTSGKLVCTSLHTATTEVCDGKDNDCDGNVDDGIASKTCYTFEGAFCFPGKTACNGGQTICNKGSSIFQCSTDANCAVCGTGSTCITIFAGIRGCQKGP